MTSRYRHKHPLTPTWSYQGFSLIELLVALLIVGLMSSLVVVNLSDGDSDRHDERLAHQLAALLRLGRAEAIVRATPLALIQQGEESPQGPALNWLSWQGSHWSSHSMKSFPLTKETGLQWISSPDSRRVNGNLSYGNRADENQAVVPDVVFYPTGEITPFVLRLGDITVQLDDFGKVQVSHDNDPALPGLGAIR